MPVGPGKKARDCDDLELVHSVRVCPGDKVSWVLTDSNRTFFLDFFSGAPFAGATRRGNNSRLTITIDAQSGSSYNYDVGFDGDPGMDPVIIVE